MAALRSPERVRIVPLHSPELEARVQPVAQLTYRGGPLLTAAEVFTVFWGSAWSTEDQLISDLDDFFDFVLTSELIDQLSEYSVSGLTIGHGSRTGTAMVTDPDVGATVTDADIQSFLADQVANNADFPQPGPNALLFVFLPSGTAVDMGGGASCEQFCGYHDASPDGFYYAVMPAADCSGCEGGLDSFAALTSTTSHELCEAITDPVPGQGWYDDANGEIGDICAWQTKQLDKYTVQREWSNQSAACV